MRRLPSSRLVRCDSGTAAAEMALVMPLLLVIIFGAFELGNYFLNNHAVAKAVRDGARYASRRSFVEYSCSTVSTDVLDKTRNITRTGQVATGGTPRVYGWTNPATITMSVSCDTSGTYTGIYTGMATGAPVVTVTAAVPYIPLFNSLGFSSASLFLRSRSQSAVMGV
ncbi:MAG: TadE/TadG family type IV pilus assembly protein [Sphingomonadaceae bacterium]